jgi:ABC-type antimicrobial peptide transport system permease subunit
MRFLDYLVLGFRNIWRRKSRSFLTIFAVVIGAISMVIMLSLVLGAKQVATSQLESINGLTLISVSPNPEIQSSGNLLNPDQGAAEESEQKLNDSTVSILKNLPNVVDATPTVGVWAKSAKLEGQDKKFRASLLAYTPGTQVLNIPVGAGRQLREGDLDKIVIGGELVRNFGYTNHPDDLIGKKIILYMQEYVNWGADPPKPSYTEGKDNWVQPSVEITAEIVGIVFNGLDEGQSYITLGWGKRLMTSKYWKNNDEKRKLYDQQRQMLEEQLRAEFEMRKNVLNEQMKDQQLTDDERKNMYNEIDLQYKQELQTRMSALGYNESDFLVLSTEDRLGRYGYGAILLRVDRTENIESVEKEIRSLGFGVQTAKETLDQIKKIFTLIGLIIGAIGGIVLFVAALGIINSMVMATYERTREIGILRACGATRPSIRNMFIFEAATLGFLGGVIGLALSFGLAKILNTVGNNIASTQGVPITNFISFPLWLIIGVVALTTFIGAISGLLPAIRASRLDPVEALRYE